LKTRILQDGRVVEELEEARTLSIKTRCPDKWMLIDMETGEQYQPYKTTVNLDWEKINAVKWKRIEF
jgi:hypothetical protein